MTVNKGYSLEQLRSITKAASLYYQHGLKQPEIAERLDFSQAGVSRALRDAERLGIVRTTVHMPSDIYADLEIALEERYGLKDAVVLEVAGQNEEERVASLGESAAAYLENVIPKNEVIGLGSWSKVLECMVAALRMLQKSRTRAIVPVAAETDQGRPEYAALLNTMGVKCGLAAAAGGGDSPASPVSVSAISLVVFAVDSRSPSPALPLRQFCAIPKRVCISGGQEAHVLIRPALADGLLTTLITDYKTATRLMAE